MKKLKTLSFIIPLSLSIFSPSLAATKFKDVPNSHWASESVNELAENNIMVGDPNGRFRGNSAISRYEMAVALTNMMNTYNREILQDREDLSSLVSILEQFQDELATLENNLTQLNSRFVVVSGNVQEQQQDIYNRVDDTDAKVDAVLSDVEDLKNRGLIYGTIIKGTFNDVKKVGQGIGYVGKNIAEQSRKRRERKEAIEETLSAAETQVDAELVDLEQLRRERQQRMDALNLNRNHSHSGHQTAPHEQHAPQQEEHHHAAPEHQEPEHQAQYHSAPEQHYQPQVRETREAPRYEAANHYQPSEHHASPKAHSNHGAATHGTSPGQEPDGEVIKEIHQTLSEMH